MSAKDLPIAEYRTWSTENLEQLIYIAERERGDLEVEREVVKVLTVLVERGERGVKSDWVLAAPDGGQR